MSADKQKFIDEVSKYAKKYMLTTGVPASLTIAQAILESNWGRSSLTVKHNNLFGIKGTGALYPTKEFVNGKEITVTASFRTYSTYEGSIRDHNEMLQRMKRYSKVIGETDYRKACQAIQSAGYATDPQYAKKLISLIEKLKLYEYDKEGVIEMEKKDADALIKIIQNEWAKATTDAQKNELHRLANVCRKLSGQPTN